MGGLRGNSCKLLALPTNSRHLCLEEAYLLKPMRSSAAVSHATVVAKSRTPLPSSDKQTTLFFPPSFYIHVHRPLLLTWNVYSQIFTAWPEKENRLADCQVPRFLHSHYTSKNLSKQDILTVLLRSSSIAMYITFVLFEQIVTSVEWRSKSRYLLPV